MDNKRIYFGAIKREDIKQKKDGGSGGDDNEEGEQPEFLPFSKHTKRSQEQHQKVLDEYERKKRAKQVIVPTVDNLVKLKLRELSEPIILFGEKPEHRRSRLREILIERNILDGTPLLISKKKQEEQEELLEDSDEENFLTEGTEELKAARINIAIYSLKKSQQRLLELKKQRQLELTIQKENENLKNQFEEKQIQLQQKILQRQQQQQQQQDDNNMKIDDDDDDGDVYSNLNMMIKTKTEFEKELEYTIKELKSYYSSVSQVGDDRPLSMGVFSPNGDNVAIGSWSGVSKVWSVSGKKKQILTGHSQRVSCIAYHPLSGMDGNYSNNLVNIATTSADSTCKLWSLLDSGSYDNNNDDYSSSINNTTNIETQPILSLEGHSDVVNRCSFHPCGRYITTSSNDKSWRMWDLESGGKCLLDQEGHSDGVMGIAIQSDGALIATGSQDGLVRIWDLRSGRPILYFQGHSKQVISVDWSPNGYQVASSSEDNSVIIWDIRKKEQASQILAHNSIVSGVKFQKQPSVLSNNGVICADYLATCSFDGKIKTWSPNTWKLLSTLEGHSSKVTSIDLTNSKILSTSFDKTWKIWSNDN
ncbi:hypothetical protein RB653_008197 [Dictyostelium firmibasis]|uniref:Pre-mRNA processing factor 4 (PRP4)-like domain-containing protein n=1 Tax=Dictyostelium firmibasis TaxID=79012 RepID=A0AAN7YZK7_9MYCE